MRARRGKAASLDGATAHRGTSSLDPRPPDPLRYRTSSLKSPWMPCPPVLGATLPSAHKTSLPAPRRAFTVSSSATFFGMGARRSNTDPKRMPFLAARCVLRGAHSGPASGSSLHCGRGLRVAARRFQGPRRRFRSAGGPRLSSPTDSTPGHMRRESAMSPQFEMNPLARGWDEIGQHQRVAARVAFGGQSG